LACGSGMDANLPTVKVAVIGVGHLGQHHARIYTELPGVELVAIADTSEARRREVGGRLRVPTVADYRSLIGTVDAVSVAGCRQAPTIRLRWRSCRREAMCWWRSRSPRPWEKPMS